MLVTETFGHADVVSALRESYFGLPAENRCTRRGNANSAHYLQESPVRFHGRMSTPRRLNYYGEMSSSAKETSAIRPQQAPRSVRVVNWPLRDGGLRAWGMLLLLGLIATSAGVVAESGAMGGVCFAALAIAAWRLWVPVTFEFRSRGVIYSVLGRSRRIPWTHIARYEDRPRGLLLFAEDDTSPLATLRSIHVQWNGQRAAILEVMAFYTAARVSAASTKTFIDATVENSGK